MMHRLIALLLLASLVSARVACVDQVTYFVEAGKTDIYRWSSKEPIKLKKRTCDPKKYYVQEKWEPWYPWETRRYEDQPILSFSQRQQLSEVVELAFLNNVLPYINSGKDETIIKCDKCVSSLIVSDYQICYLQEGKEANVNGETYTSNIGIDREGNGTDKVFGKYSVVVSYSCNGQARERSVGFTFDGKATMTCAA